MAKRYTLTLTEDQAEILGFALTRAWKERDSLAKTRRNRAKWTTEERASIEMRSAETAAQQATRIEELRALLDVCPVSED